MKTKELRVYGISVSESQIDNINGATDEEFMAEAERQGQVFSLEGFKNAFNADEFGSEDGIIRFIETEAGEATEDATNVKINIVELASELADKELREKHQDGIDIDEEDGEDGTKYTEEAQDIFNDLYDDYYAMIEKTRS